MNQFSEQLLPTATRRRKIPNFGPVVLIGAPLLAILFQVYVPRFFEYLSYLELPLLITVYYALMRRSPIAGLLYGAAIGLVQDSLSHQPIGIYGIVKTLVGYFAGSVSVRFDVDRVPVRFVLAFFFFIFHQLFYWVMVRALLGENMEFDLQQTLVIGALNSAVSLPLFHVLDKLRATG